LKSNGVPPFPSLDAFASSLVTILNPAEKLNFAGVNWELKTDSFFFDSSGSAFDSEFSFPAS
jgi:hypothetical protein